MRRSAWLPPERLDAARRVRVIPQTPSKAQAKRSTHPSRLSPEAEEEAVITRITLAARARLRSQSTPSTPIMDLWGAKWGANSQAKWR